MLAESSKGRAGLATCMNMSNAKNGQECVIRRFIFILGVCLLTTMISFLRDVTVTMFHRHNGSTMKNTGNVWIEKEHKMIMLRRVGVEVLK